jgi:hypothetical protein
MNRYLIAVVLLALSVLPSVGFGQGNFVWDLDADGKLRIFERGGVPDWKVDERFKNDVFTFARVMYSSGYSSRDFSPRGLSTDDLFFRSAESSTSLPFFAQRQRGGRGRGGRGGGGGRGVGGRWATDFPEADVNFSYRLHQLTSFTVNPTPAVVQLADEDLFDYPFIYMVEVHDGGLRIAPDEATNLRRYLLNGGFLMVDDFWSQAGWEWFAGEMKLVFPDREFVELPLEHEIFRSVYKMKEKPQVRAYNYGSSDITYEPNHGPGSETVHYRALLDDKGRIMVLACHNTDLGDGWEREGYDEWYFHNFCENKSYPMGINIVTYALTH